MARQRDLDRSVAIKLLLADVLTDEDQVERFTQEARITASISHENVIRVFDYGAMYGIPWIAYEYLPGRSLREILQSGSLDLGRAIVAVAQVATALEAAHALGVWHRDIKPDNVLEVAEDRYKVTDFGIAKWASGGAVRTRTGMILGTPAYLSPEQISGEPASPASDVYALGVVLFELVTGELPFHDANPLALLERHLRSPIPKASDVKLGVPQALDAGVLLRPVLRSLSHGPGREPVRCSRRGLAGGNRT